MAQQAAGNPTVNYAEQVAKLEASVKELSEQYAKDGSEETRRALERRQDALLHVKNLSKGDPKARAERAAAKAREFVRSIAVG
jgi:hypothetical protein